MDISTTWRIQAIWSFMKSILKQVLTYRSIFPIETAINIFSLILIDKLSKKQSSHSPQNNEHHDNNDEVIDEYINIYKEPIKSEEDDEDDDEEA